MYLRREHSRREWAELSIGARAGKPDRDTSIRNRCARNPCARNSWASMRGQQHAVASDDGQLFTVFATLREEFVFAAGIIVNLFEVRQFTTALAQDC
jgi:hypothetical protein